LADAVAVADANPGHPKKFLVVLGFLDSVAMHLPLFDGVSLSDRPGWACFKAVGALEHRLSHPVSCSFQDQHRFFLSQSLIRHSSYFFNFGHSARLVATLTFKLYFSTFPTRVCCNFQGSRQQAKR
jgi:hypothetical protein